MLILEQSLLSRFTSIILKEYLLIILLALCYGIYLKLLIEETQKYEKAEVAKIKDGTISFINYPDGTLLHKISLVRRILITILIHLFNPLGLACSLL
jgi:hypothetical protein